MCGIAGFTWSDKNLLKTMLDSLAHRGPDGEGLYSNQNVSLGHRRLAVIDLSKTANQPLFNENGSLITVCNGEIYNYNELRNHLIAKGHIFYTNTDSEVIPHLFEEYRSKSFELLNGMFAFAIYDKKTEELFLVVDHLAIKNIYYSIVGNDLIFASECKAIFKHDKIKKEINGAILKDIITYGYNPGVDTPFKHIKLLRPGTFLHKSKEKITLHKYYQFQKQNIKYSRKKLYNLLDNAIRKTIISDVPVAFILSGGLDSSMVVAMASKYCHKLNVFSLGLSEKDNEFYYSRILAEKFKFNYTEIILSDSIINSEIPKALYHQETPQDTGSMLPNWYLAKVISRKGFKVVLGGDGADENWCGYTRHSGLYDMYAKYKSLNKENNRQYFNRYIMKNPGDPWLFDEFLQKKPWCDICSFFDIFHEIPFYHNIRLDKVFMAWGIEYRPPFLDRELVQFSLNIPFQNKIKGGERKFLLKSVMEDLLPKEILERPKKPLKITQVIENGLQWQHKIIEAWKSVYNVRS